MDIIRVNSLSLTPRLAGGSRWPPKDASSQPKPQPVLVTLSVPHDISSTARTDELQHSINYSTLASSVRDKVNAKNQLFESLEDLMASILDVLLDPVAKEAPELSGARLKVTQVKPPLHCKHVSVEAEATRSGGSPWTLTAEGIRHRIEDLECDLIVGVNPSEREEKQVVRISITIHTSGQVDMEGDLSLKNKKGWLDFRALSRVVYEAASKSSYLTLEALASHIALQTLNHLLSVNTSIQPCNSGSNPKVTVKAAKPYAIVFAKSSEVEIVRSWSDYPDTFQAPFSSATSITSKPSTVLPLTSSQGQTQSFHTAAIALGSNLGDRFQNIETALRSLEYPKIILSSQPMLPEDAFVTVINTSFLYESAPMYVTDQPAFVNCAILVNTNLKPQDLLVLLKAIETLVGRVPSIRNGPRAVDLDLVLYDEEVVDTRSTDNRVNLDNLEGQLVVPHPRMQEREFVLRPLYDMIPTYTHPILQKTISQLLDELLARSTEEHYEPMQRVIPFPQYPIPSTSPSRPVSSIDPVPPTSTYWKYPSPNIPPSYNSSSKHLAIISHSQNPKHRTYLMSTLNTTPDSFSDGSRHNKLPTALGYALSSFKEGADILDIGGYSTRPGAAWVSPEEEIERVVPVVKAIRDGDFDIDSEEKTEEEEKGLRDMLISLDTFRPEVARAGILAGANCINDVYAFSGPTYPSTPSSNAGPSNSSSLLHDNKTPTEYTSEMKSIARAFAVPVVLMHSRGDAGSNKDYSAYSYSSPNSNSSSSPSDSPVIEAIRIELGAKVDQIVLGPGGVRRWLVIVDPGVGFSKTVEGNLDVLRGSGRVVADVVVGPPGSERRNPLVGFPQLIGASRKSFLGKILEEEEEEVEGKGRRGRQTRPDERTFATAAAVSAAVQQSALVVRVHDVREMGDVVRIADRIWR
ncbi:Dihydropteroate synthase [Dendrothele bispora CBS 962.96]|uniref:2-amino-4-hydroxy-6-hydroxymethyldihydropteridine diphosphokinase n=1 Tax=Dendrothele bispora (strain CBS 962.96) TaxID=1314807 RepID=A0A4S8MSE6_DENBC|nr:Dihydropteroate synthase [Dendrothele bispora CBS 962.96]